MRRLKHPCNFDYDLITEASDLPKVAKDASAGPFLCLDIETAAKDEYRDRPKAALDPLLGDIRLIQLKTGESKYYVIDLFQTGTLGPLREVLESDLVIIIHNAKFEQKWFLHHFGIRFKRIFDTLRASRLIYNGKPEAKGHDLYALLKRELDAAPPTTDEGASNWGGRLTDRQLEYAASDVLYLDDLYATLKRKLLSSQLVQVAELEFDVVLPEAAIELTGIGFDVESWTALAHSNMAKKAEYREKLLTLLPSPTDQLMLPGLRPEFNLDSDKQMLESLIRLGLKEKVKDPDTGQIYIRPLSSTTENVLAQFKKKYPVVKDILDYREYSKGSSSFGLSFLDFVHPVTGRIHTNYFGYTGAGRFSSNKPNLQQIPRSKLFRRCFCAALGKLLVGADFSGEELRIAAEVSGDKALRKIFIDGLDPHRNTASMINGIGYDDITDSMRQEAKAMNFGLLYGMGAAKFVIYALATYNVVFKESEARRFKNKFFDSYKGVALWHDKALRDGRRCGYTRTKSGRIRYLDPETTYSAWFNTPVQGTGADILKVALRRVYDRLLRDFGSQAYMVHHVHDEILTECDETPGLAEAVSKAMQEEMTEAFYQFIRSVPCKVDPHFGRNWSEIH